MTTWRRDEDPMPLKRTVTVTVTTGVSEQDRLLLEGLGLQFNAAGTECTFPTGKGIMTLPSQVSDEAFNEEHTRVVAHTLSQFFQVGDSLVSISTRFSLPAGGKVQPQWTTLSVLAQSPAAQGAHSGEGADPAV
jgi:hypothetical protein